jgi:hypothetical protein
VGYYNNRITYGGRILKTTDAGATWDTISCGTPYNLISVFFADQNTGYAVGISGTILKTTDAGATWTAQSSGTTNILHAVYFTSANTGWAVGDSGTILKTTNGGYGLGLDDHQPAISSANNLKIYPNPATEKITVEPSEAGMNLKGVVNIYRVTGQPLIRQQVQSSVAEINVGSLPAGIYFLTLVNNEKVAVGKFIKN